MSNVLSPFPIFSAQNLSTGAPLAGGKLYTYAANSNTPKATYNGANGTANTNPVILNAAGQANVWYGAGSYKLVLNDANDVNQWTVDNITPDSSSTLVVSVSAFGAVGDDSTDDTVAIQNAINFVGAAGGGEVFFPAGRFKVTQPLTCYWDQVNLVGTGVRGSAIRVYHDLGIVLQVQAATGAGNTMVNSFTMRDMSMRAMIVTTQGCHLQLNQVNQVYVTNVQFEDHYGGVQILGGVDHYYTATNIFSPRNSGTAGWTGVKTGSFFLYIDVSSGGRVPSEMFFNTFNFRRSDTSSYVENGIIVKAADGIWFNNGHILGVSNAQVLITPNALGNLSLGGLKFTQVWFDNFSTYALYVTGNTTAYYGAVTYTGCYFLGAASNHIFVDASANTFEGIYATGCDFNRSQLAAVLVRSGTGYRFSACGFRAANASGATNTGAVTIDYMTTNFVVENSVFSQTFNGLTCALMIGVRMNATSSGIVVKGNTFMLDAGIADISDNQADTTNQLWDNYSNKSATTNTVTGSSLIVPAIGTEYEVIGTVSFINISGRYDHRPLTLVMQGAVTVTSGTFIKLLGSANYTFKSGDTLTLVYSPGISAWIETSRMIS